jgi:hypothetical protein
MELVPMSTAATERLDFRGDDLADRVVAMATRETRRVVGVVSMKAFDAEARPGHASLRPMGRVFGDHFVALDPVPLVGILQALTKIKIVAGTRFDKRDVPSRLDPGHPADRQRTAQPVARRERGAVVEDWRNLDHNRQSQMASHYRLGECAERSPQLGSNHLLRRINQRKGRLR